MFETKEEASEGDAERVVIFSDARSGSTWMQTALNQHPEVFCTEFRSFGGWADFVHDLRPDGTSRKRLRVTGDALAEALSGHINLRGLGLGRPEFVRLFSVRFARFLFDFCAEASGKRVIVDKFTAVGSVATAQVYLEELPEVKRVFLVRDGRDVAVSMAMDWLTKRKDGQDFEREAPRFRKFVQKQECKVERFFDDDEIKRLAGNWHRNVHSFGSICDLKFTYEEMKADQGAVLEKLLGYLGVDASEGAISRCVSGSTFEKMSGGRTAGEAGSVAKARSGVAGGWTQFFTQRDAEIFEAEAGESLRKHGYEDGPSWVGRCPMLLTF